MENSDPQLGQPTLDIDFRVLGDTGLPRYGDYVIDDNLPCVYGLRGVQVYREMVDTDPICAGAIGNINLLIRRAPFRVKAASQLPDDIAAAEFLETCMHDMRTSWVEVIAEAASMVQYGHSVHEIVYKRRAGKSDAPGYNSKHDDGRVGWADLPIRGQETLTKWRYSPHGEILGVVQRSMPLNKDVYFPIEDILLFRTNAHRNGPYGRSALRGAVSPWFKKRNIEDIEAIGIERDLVGVPHATVPIELLSKSATPDQRAQLAEIKRIGTSLRNNKQAFIATPSTRDEKGNLLFDFKLITSGGSRSFDTDKIIQRYARDIGMSMQADFMMLGNGSTGSYAMHSDKRDLFTNAITVYLDIICSVFNEQAIPRLMEMNTFKMSGYPTIEHGRIEPADVKELGAYIQTLVAAGMPMFPNPELEKYLCEVGGLPAPPSEEAFSEDQHVQDSARMRALPIREIHDDTSLGPEEPDPWEWARQQQKTGVFSAF